MTSRHIVNTDSKWRWRPIAVSLILLAFVAAAYWPVRDCAFVNFDDPDYVTENFVVRGGLTLEGLRWAFSTTHAANWHPLTWVSHMLDCNLFALNPAGHHATNVLFHAINSLLLFALLKRMTGALWRSAFVAALFALHPLRVESVAWISERKDVLSAFFGLLSLWAWMLFVLRAESVAGGQEVHPPSPRLWRTRSSSSFVPPRVTSAAAKAMADRTEDKRFRDSSKPAFWYALSLVLFALSLLSKPMLVTLPFLMLLLDFWPFNRSSKRQRVSASERDGLDAAPRSHAPTLSRSHVSSHWSLVSCLILEKLPFFALSLVSAIITLIVQQKAGATPGLATFPLLNRCSNAFISYVRYCRNMLWPDSLTICYPPVAWPLWQGLCAFVTVLLLSIIAVIVARRRPYVFVGWFWFLVGLFPVIGLIQAGVQSLADRYTYFPSIGLLLALSWGLNDCVRRWPRLWLPILAGACGSVLVLGYLTNLQVRHWHDSETLFTRALAVTRSNALAEAKLGEALLQERKNLAAAKEHFVKAIQLAPQFSEAHYDMGTILQAEGKHVDAIVSWQTALGLRPNWAPLMNNLAWTLATCPDPSCRNPTEAVRLATRACSLEPGLFNFYDTLAAAHAAAGDFPQAVAACSNAVVLAEIFHQPAAAARYRARQTLYLSKRAYFGQ